MSFASDGLQRVVESESIKWVEDRIALLESEGRPIEGGWPGTVSEARSRLMTYLIERGEAPPRDAAEVKILVDMLYDKAKQLWLRKATRHHKHC